MVNIHTMRKARQPDSSLVLASRRKSWVKSLLHSGGLIISLLGPAFVVCFAGGSILVFAAILFHDAMSATVGAILYHNATRATAVSVVPSNRDWVPDVDHLRPAA